MKISLIQTTLAWEDAAANRTHFTSLIDTIQTDLIVLPEMFATGFTMNPANVAEAPDGPVSYTHLTLPTKRIV